MKADLIGHIEKLIEKAAATHDSSDAMKFSQAACNAANALCALKASGVEQRG